MTSISTHPLHRRPFRVTDLKVGDVVQYSASKDADLATLTSYTVVHTSPPSAYEGGRCYLSARKDLPITRMLYEEGPLTRIRCNGDEYTDRLPAYGIDMRDVVTECTQALQCHPAEIVDRVRELIIKHAKVVAENASIKDAMNKLQRQHGDRETEHKDQMKTQTAKLACARQRIRVIRDAVESLSLQFNVDES